MFLFKKQPKYTSVVFSKPNFPDGRWQRCEDCNQIFYKDDIEKNFWTCPKCQYHFQIDPYTRLSFLLDEGSFVECDTEIKSIDFLNFNDIKPYSQRLKEAGEGDAFVSGVGNICGEPVAIGVLDFKYMGGSMGSVVGEKVVRACERAIERRLPLIFVTSSGGARVQEGTIALLQMAKTASAVAQLSQKGGLLICVLTNPTTGGVWASFASLGDVLIAEPKALIGFAGPRVIQQTIGEKLPPDFQRAEFLLEHGLIDMIVHRKNLKETIHKIIDIFCN